jgi:hypothetical protein
MGENNKLTNIIEYEGPKSFSREKIFEIENLFNQRCALFYTPTENIPSQWIGKGPLDVVLPIPTPSYHEYFEIYGYKTPRLWVDLLQRVTGKIRWQPNNPAQLNIIRFDYIELPDYAIVGAKALVDALKVKTSGRPDGRLLYYFGAIYDDGPRYITEWKFQQKLVSRPDKAKTRIIIKPDQK